MWGDDLTTAVVRCDQQTVQRPPKAGLDVGLWFDPSCKNQEAHCDSSLSVDLNGMAADRM
jgi:hypothetical protein